MSLETENKTHTNTRTKLYIGKKGSLPLIFCLDRYCIERSNNTWIMKMLKQWFPVPHIGNSYNPPEIPWNFRMNAAHRDTHTLVL